MHFKKLLAFSTAITLSLGAFAPSLHAVNPGESEEECDSPTQLTRDPDYDTRAARLLRDVTRYSNRWQETHPITPQTPTERFIQRFLDAITSPDNTTFVDILTTVPCSESLDRKLLRSRFTFDSLRNRIINILGEDTDMITLCRDIIQMRGDARPERTQPKNVAPPKKTEATEFYTKIEFFVRRLYSLAHICEMNSTTSATETANTRNRASSTPVVPETAARRRSPSPVTPITPVVPELKTQRERGASLSPTRTAKLRAPSPVAPIVPVVPEHKTPGSRAGSTSPTRPARPRPSSPVARIAPVVPEHKTPGSRAGSTSPTRPAQPRPSSPVTPITSVVPTTAARQRAKSMTSTPIQSAPSSVDQVVPATTEGTTPYPKAAAAAPTTPDVSNPATRPRSKSMVSSDYYTEAASFLEPLVKHADDWRTLYGSYVSGNAKVESLIDNLCQFAKNRYLFNAFCASWRKNSKKTEKILGKSAYHQLHLAIEPIVGATDVDIMLYVNNSIGKGDTFASAFYFNAYGVLDHMRELFPLTLKQSQKA